MHHAGHDREAVDKLYALVKDVKVAMMTTVDETGSLHSRPMYNQEADDKGDFWFFTKTRSGKTEEIRKDSKVNLGWSDPSKQHYVSVAGRAEIVRDRATIEAKWSEGLRTWFPKGVDDPSIALIRVIPEEGEYWDSPSSTVLHLYGYVKSALTGKPPTELGEQKKVGLR